MTQTEPTVGAHYSCSEQYMMHGGTTQATLPELNGKVTLIRFHEAKNPDGPNIIDHGPPESFRSRLSERIDMLRRQSEPLPVYKRVSSRDWEYLGRYRVRSITEDAHETAERSRRCDREIKYVIRLEEAG